MSSILELNYNMTYKSFSGIKTFSIGTADINVRALRDTPQWGHIKEEALQMWKEMKDTRNYIIPNRPRHR